MKTSITPGLQTSFTLALAGLLAGVLASACDLPDKDLGADPTDSATGDPATDSGDGPCMDGDTKMEDCNTCVCESGSWACTEIACGDDSGGTSGASGTTGGACDPTELPDCGECVCVDGEWECSDPPGGGGGGGGCNPTTGSTGGDECDPATKPDDGCNECICESGEWLCTDLACPLSEPVEVCTGAEPTDPFTILDAMIVDHQLQLSVQYSGGCLVHDFGACWDESFAESEPVQATIDISHADPGDPCDALPIEMVAFDLSPVRNAWIDAYMQVSGTITLNVPGWGSLDYSF